MSFQQVADQARELQRSSKMRFFEVAKSVAMGGKIKAEELVDLCSESGYSIEDFEATMEVVKHRNQIRKNCEDLPELERQDKELEQLLKEDKENIERAKLEWEERAKGRVRAVDEIRRQIRELRSQQAELENGCPNKFLLEERDRLKAEKTQLLNNKPSGGAQTVREWQRTLTEKQNILSKMKSNENTSIICGQINELKTRIKRAESAIREREAALSDVQMRIEQIDSEIEAY